MTKPTLKVKQKSVFKVEKLALNKRLIELNTIAYGCQVHSDDFFLDWKIPNMKKEIERLEKALGGKNERAT